MEVTGHYYTVYFTSLAVGFAKDIAYRHAVLAQMPDQIKVLDAANLHMNYCRFTPEIGSRLLTPNAWRVLIEFSLHSLVDRSSSDISSVTQRLNTSRLLLDNRPDSLEFGLLLHRLGDTYAHSIMGREKEMYTIDSTGSHWQCLNLSHGLGHGRDGHSPDYPFLRPVLFNEYLDNLYTILLKKVKGSKVIFKRHVKPMSISVLKGVFSEIFEATHKLNPHWIGVRPNMGIQMLIPLTYNERQLLFIQQIRDQSYYRFKIKMNSAYNPEREELQTLPEFLKNHPELEKLHIKETLEKTINNLNGRLTKVR